jgi:uncharacterized integral membrane protein (TIGR00698 family)
VLPGVTLLVAVAVVARIGGARLSVAPLLLAVAAGAAVGLATGRPERLRPGVAIHGPVLKAAIALLGAGIAAADVGRAGPTVVGVAVTGVAVALLSVETISRLGLGLRDETGSLLASGAALCGVSAIATVGESIDASDDRIAYAAAVVLAFDAITLALFPAVGTLLGLRAKVYGIWAGLNVFSTGPAVAAGFARGEVAGPWATATTLARNALIGVVAGGYALRYGSDEPVGLRSFVDRVPVFLVAFVVLAAAAALGLLPAALRSVIDAAVNWLFLVAFAGIGYGIRPGAIREAGIRPAAAVAVHLVALSAISLLLLRALVG